MQSCFDCGDYGAKGPSISSKLPIGQSKFTPYVQHINWQARIAKEDYASYNAAPPASGLFQTGRNLTPPSTPGLSDSDTTMRFSQYLNDPEVRRSVTRVMRRVKEIRSGSPISMAPLGHPRTKLLAAAAPFLDDSQRQELDDFTATHLKFASRCSTPAGGTALPSLSRPGSVASLRSRVSAAKGQLSRPRSVLSRPRSVWSRPKSVLSQKSFQPST